RHALRPSNKHERSCLGLVRRPLSRQVDAISEVTTLVQGATVEVFVWTLLVLEFVALLSVPSVLLRRRGRPTAAIAWLLALFALPALGSITWWTIGRTRIERRLRRRRLTRR